MWNRPVAKSAIRSLIYSSQADTYWLVSKASLFQYCLVGGAELCGNVRVGGVNFKLMVGQACVNPKKKKNSC